MWPNPQETTDLVTLTEEIFAGKIHFVFSELNRKQILILPLKQE